jgi:hypothetical protein
LPLGVGTSVPGESLVGEKLRAVNEAVESVGASGSVGLGRSECPAAFRADPTDKVASINETQFSRVSHARSSGSYFLLQWLAGIVDDHLIVGNFASSFAARTLVAFSAIAMADACGAFDQASHSHVYSLPQVSAE